MSQIMDLLTAFAVARGAHSDPESVAEFYEDVLPKLSREDRTEFSTILLAQENAIQVRNLNL